MEQNNFRVYGYRWVILTVFMFVVAMNQLLWITFASITSSAASFYGVSDIKIGLLSLCFMIVYIIIAIPASWIIDTFGIRIGVGIGAILTGAFGLLRGIFAANYNMVLISQIGIAIGQPFILTALTTVAARWFPIRERGMATGLGSLASYLGIVAGLAFTPYLLIYTSMSGMLFAYGIVAITAAILFMVFIREHPPTPPCNPDQTERALVLDGFRNIIHQPSFLLLLFVFFIGLGVFNAVTTWIEDILKPRNFSITQAGIIGGLMVVGGVVGAVIMPALSDRYRKRVPFLIIAIVGSIPGLIGITFAVHYWVLLVSAFSMGFFLLSAGPIGFQYAAEITYPAPEGMSNGLLLLMGQISGIIFIITMDGLRMPGSGGMTFSLVGLILLMALCLLVCSFLKDSKLLQGNQDN
jgi:sugar phosphate permease